MIDGEAHLPMSLLERISDEPCEPHAYLDYAIADVRGRIDYWKSKSPNGRWWDVDADATVACVVGNLDWALHFLEEVKEKFQRWPERLAMLEAAKGHSAAAALLAPREQVKESTE